MKKARLFIVLVCLLAASNYLLAQEAQTTSTRVDTKGFYIGAQASTNGWGFDLKYVFNKIISLKTGVETLSVLHDFNFDENDISYGASLNYNTGGLFLLTDLNFTKNLYLSMGAAINSLNPEIKGQANSDLEYGDIIIPADKVGEFSLSLTPAYKISPYAALGFRSFLGKKERLSYNLETGFYYLGSPNIEIEATGLLAPTADPAHGQEQVLENQFSQYKFYPVVKFGVAIKLF